MVRSFSGKVYFCEGKYSPLSSVRLRRIPQLTCEPPDAVPALTELQHRVERYEHRGERPQPHDHRGGLHWLRGGLHDHRDEPRDHRGEPRDGDLRDRLAWPSLLAGSWI